MLERIQELDERILFFIQENMRNPVLDRVMVFITSLGNAGFLWIGIAFLFILQKRYQKCGISLLCSITLSMFLGDNLLKPLIGRIRPCNQFPEVELLIPAFTTPSFPSGHTMVAFASATIIIYYHRKFGVLFYIVAALISFSRLYLFVHYPSDVLGGIILGITTSIIILHGLKRVYQNLSYDSTYQ